MWYKWNYTIHNVLFDFFYLEQISCMFENTNTWFIGDVPHTPSHWTFHQFVDSELFLLWGYGDWCYQSFIFKFLYMCFISLDAIYPRLDSLNHMIMLWLNLAPGKSYLRGKIEKSMLLTYTCWFSYHIFFLVTAYIVSLFTASKPYLESKPS